MNREWIVEYRFSQRITSHPWRWELHTRWIPWWPAALNMREALNAAKSLARVVTEVRIVNIRDEEIILPADLI